MRPGARISPWMRMGTVRIVETAAGGGEGVREGKHNLSSWQCPPAWEPGATEPGFGLETAHFGKNEGGARKGMGGGGVHFQICLAKETIASEQMLSLFLVLFLLGLQRASTN